MRPPSPGQKSHHLKFVLLDTGFAPGLEFCTRLLAIGDFQKSTLDKFGPRSLPKESLASYVANRVTAREAVADDIVIEFCRQSRMWLSIRIGNSGVMPTEQRSAYQFLTEFGQDGWYGPFRDVEQSVHWYVHAKSTDNFVHVTNGDRPIKTRIRSHLIAQVNSDCVALHWNNYHYAEEADARRIIPCDDWNTVPAALDELAALLGAAWLSPNLVKVILNTLRNQYGRAEGFKWTHNNIRAEREGIVINARSGAALRRIKGLELLTEALAHAALRTLGLKSDDPKLEDVSNSILETLIEHWGTKSYDCSIDQVFPPKGLFRGHCYFGTKPDDRGPDAFQHILCNASQYGGSRAAYEFLLPFIPR